MNAKLTIYATLLPVIMLFSCTDKELLEDANRTPSNIITFSAMASAAVDGATSRSAEKEIYEPLELADGDGSATLYLHTYDSECVGFDPADVTDTDNSRGVQVDSPDALLKFHGTFKAHAALLSGNDYISWADTRCKGQENADKNIWLPQRTEYWPAEEMLAFHAVAPAAEYSALSHLIAGHNSMQFRYTARKGNTGADAEAQPDLLVATSVCNKAGSDLGRAPLKFHHALSAVKFAIRDVLAGEVVNIQIAGVKSSGTCAYTFDPETQLGQFNWSELEGNETFSQNFNYAVDDRGIIDPSDESKDLMLNNKMPEKTFMMIPQEIPADAEIIVTLKRTGMTPEQITVRGKIRANNVTEWKPGHEYVYTISTSKDNWIYVLTATGNHNPASGAHNVDGTQIFVYSPSAKEHETYENNAYFKVTSYRYRANKPAVKELLPWKAGHNDARQYRVRTTGDIYVANRDLKAADWISDPAKLAGSGSLTPELHNITFAAHHQQTDWPGDTWMQDQEPYAGNSQTSPWDLSRCGGSTSRNTANCYVIDREGWYCFPLVYGNAITDNDDNTSAYHFEGTNKFSGAKYLTYFKDYKDWDIKAPQIPDDYAKNAQMVWSDVYNAISDIDIATVGGERMVIFHANKFNLQQGNAVIAVTDKDKKITWSWHIWISEHWLEPGTGKPNALTGPSFEFEAAEQSGWRQRGDLPVNHVALSGFEYMLAAYNLGWCDPKNVDYFRRPGKMEVVQYQSDGTTPTGHTAALDIMQDGAHINYKFGNNTYYQFGRKDPIIGFVNHENTVKTGFGPLQYDNQPQGKTIGTSITQPNVLYCNGSNDAKNDDWCTTQWVNIWNNSTKVTLADIPASTAGTNQCIFYATKTIYDPCPPGYMVPPAGVFEFVGKADNNEYNMGGESKFALTHMNGIWEPTDTFTFRIWNDPADIVTQKAETAFWLTSTGNRWYTYSRPTVAAAGANFNPGLVYLWSSTPQGPTSRSGLSLALGYDRTSTTADKFAITPFLIARRAMGRPVRPIREAYKHP